jgi:hypothetical protein
MLSVSAPSTASHDWDMPAKPAQPREALNWQQALPASSGTPRRRKDPASKPRAIPAGHARRPASAVSGSTGGAGGTAPADPLTWQQELLRSSGGRPHSYTPSSALDWPAAGEVSPKKERTGGRPGGRRPASEMATPVSAPPAGPQAFEPFQFDDVFAGTSADEGGGGGGGTPGGLRAGTKSAPPYGAKTMAAGGKGADRTVAQGQVPAPGGAVRYAGPAFSNSPSPANLPGLPTRFGRKVEEAP